MVEEDLGVSIGLENLLQLTDYQVEETEGQLFIAFEVFAVHRSRQVFVKAHLRDGRYLERFCILGLCLNFGTLYFKPQSLRRTSVGSKMNENLLNCLTPLALNRLDSSVSFPCPIISDGPFGGLPNSQEQLWAITEAFFADAVSDEFECDLIVFGIEHIRCPSLAIIN